MDFGIMFFSSSAQTATDSRKYGLLIDAARYADTHGFTATWTPERHFHEFGGLFPNPALTSAALAMTTSNLQIRAGSLISPLHHAVRIAEDWSVIDNLSGGRVAISFGSGWNINDFIFFPERYATRQAVMYEQVKTVCSLWRGEPVEQTNSLGKKISVTIYPKPIQAELPVWITSSGNAETFASAGAIGANILTHLIGQDLETLATKIQRYRKARDEGGFDAGAGKVSLMLHTYLGDDLESVKAKVRHPFREYLRSAINLEETAAKSGGVISGGHQIDPHHIPDSVREELLDITFERYFRTAALMGTQANCRELIWQLESIGVDEIACLIDFLDDDRAILESLEYINQVRESFSPEALNQHALATAGAFMDNLGD
jgi:natural product biosynthesis luciferase-like monooxygenase protein